MVGNVVNNILGNKNDNCAYCGRNLASVKQRPEVAGDYLCDHCHGEWIREKRRNDLKRGN